MTQNYSWTLEKQNHSDPPTHTKKHSVTNSALRRKIDHNLALVQRSKNNHTDPYKPESSLLDQSNTCEDIKRDNARKRGFEMRVSNIENISSKIEGLLGLLRKDQQVEGVGARVQNGEDARFQRRQAREKQATPRKQNVQRNGNFSKSNPDTAPTYANQQPATIKAAEHRKAQSLKNNLASAMKSNQHSNQIQNIQQIRQSYFQSQRKKAQKPVIFDHRKQMKDQQTSLNESYKQKQKETKRYETTSWMKQVATKPVKNEHQTTESQKIGQRKRQRFAYVEHESAILPSAVVHARSLLKPRSYAQSQTPYNKLKQPWTPAVRLEGSSAQKSHEKTASQPLNSLSPAHNHSSKQSDHYNFSNLACVQEQPYSQQRSGANTQQIDQQLHRIRNQIMQSQATKKKPQKSNPNQFLERGHGKTHVFRLAECISSQAELDSTLRTFRQSFCKMSGLSKWSQLQTLAFQQGLNLSGDQLRKLITMGTDEQNPFSSQTCNISIQQFMDLFAAAQRNWSQCVLKCVASRNLKNQNFQISDLDLSGKGFLSLQDLVCFVNLYCNSFYRNRDLALAMRRLQLRQRSGHKEGIDYQTFWQSFVS